MYVSKQAEFDAEDASDWGVDSLQGAEYYVLAVANARAAAEAAAMEAGSR